MEYSYYEKNRDKIKERRKEYIRTHRKEINAKALDYYHKIKNTEKYKEDRKKRNTEYYILNKEVVKESSKKYKKNNSKVVKQKDILRKHNITNQFYKDLLDNCGGMCLICGIKSDLNIDHDHVSGEVRGMLCRSCNLGLGFFRDNTIYLHKAIEYLEYCLAKNINSAPKLNIKKGDIKS